MHVPITSFGPYRRGPEPELETDMIGKKTRIKSNKRTERTRMNAKANSPGVPPNSCPYIDLTISMVQDLQESYEKYRETGHHNPMVDDIGEQAKNLLEYIRKANETLRDNSAYWYGKYKDLLNKQNNKNK